ncbi:MAG: hypothetical protein HOV80_32840 [Polyangiaceae bacterium]|nr:hypothetical protein [Polyangiaceae bacterium]
MRSSVLVRGGRVAAGAALVTAGVINVLIVEIWPSLDGPEEVVKLFLLLFLFALGPAIAAWIATFSKDYETARGRVFMLAALAGALPPAVAMCAGEGSALLWVLASCPWAMALAWPTLPLVRAVIEAKESPSFDAFDRVLMMAFGFLVAVKTPEALGALFLGESTAALMMGALAAIGAIGFAVIHRRRVRRAERVKDLLAADGLKRAPELDATEEAALLSGAPRLRILRAAGSPDYRHDEPTELVAIVPETPVMPSVKSDIGLLAQSLCVAGFLALAAVAVGSLGRSF